MDQKNEKQRTQREVVEINIKCNHQFLDEQIATIGRSIKALVESLNLPERPKIDFYHNGYEIKIMAFNSKTLGMQFLSAIQNPQNTDAAAAGYVIFETLKKNASLFSVRGTHIKKRDSIEYGPRRLAIKYKECEAMFSKLSGK